MPYLYPDTVLHRFSRERLLVRLKLRDDYCPDPQLLSLLHEKRDLGRGGNCGSTARSLRSRANIACAEWVVTRTGASALGSMEMRVPMVFRKCVPCAPLAKNCITRTVKLRGNRPNTVIFSKRCLCFFFCIDRSQDMYPLYNTEAGREPTVQESVADPGLFLRPVVFDEQISNVRRPC
jgi:hypothetical protein